jgi:hypothetical protein
VPDPETSIDPSGSEIRASEGAARDRNRERLVEELATVREENLRLRDLLIGKDAELGQAKGRVTELEDQIERYTRLLDRLRLRRIIPAIGRRLRRLGGDSS